ncbi:MAG: hypothetical protein CMM02_14195 [Rhodopirellula sp.]|jgi:hypothetical protein|nr:hypothetical protein [Rhodopirellula sp.]
MDEEEEDSKCCDWEPSRPKKMRKLPSSMAHASIINLSNNTKLTEEEYQKYMRLVRSSSNEKETIEEVKTVLNNIKEGRSSELLWIHKHRSVDPAAYGAEAMCDEFREIYPVINDVVTDDDNSSALYPVGFHAGMMYMANCLEEIMNAKWKQHVTGAAQKWESPALQRAQLLKTKYNLCSENPGSMIPPDYNTVGDCDARGHE